MSSLPDRPLLDLLMVAASVPEHICRVLDLPLLDFFHAATETRLSLRCLYEQMAALCARTSMAANPRIFQRAIRPGVISREWLHSALGRQVNGFLRQLTDVESYLRTHRMIGHEPT